MKKMNVLKTTLAVLSAVMICFGYVFADETAKETDKTPEEVPELYKLSNEELIKQAQDTYNSASADYLTQMRRLHAYETLHATAQEKTATVSIPEKTPPATSEASVPAEAAKAAADHAKSRVDAISRLLEQIQAEKTLLDKLIRQSENAKSAAGLFVNTIDGLNLFLLEIRLRTEDGTLPPDKVPDFLGSEKLENRKADLIAIQGELENKTQIAQEDIKTAVSLLEELKKTLAEAEAQYTSAENQYSQKLKQQTLEKEYSGQSPERLTAALSELQENRIWLKGSFNISRSRFESSQTDASVIQQQIEGLTPPETPEILQKWVVTNAGELDQASKQVDEISAYHSSRVKKLGEFRSALESLIKDAEIFEGDATVLADHLSKIQVTVQILDDFVRQGKLAADSIPSDVLPEKLADEIRKVSDLTASAEAEVQKSREQLDWINTETKKSGAAREEILERMANLRKSHEAEVKNRGWESGIKELATPEIVQRFRENTEKLEKNRTVIKEREAEYKKADAAAKEAEHKFESLKGSLVRAAEDESAEEKDNILKALYEFAGLKPPAEKKPSPAPSAPAGKKTGEKKSDKDAAKKEEKTEEKQKKAEAGSPGKNASVSDTETFQNLLSNLAGITEEKQKQQLQYVETLKTLDQKIGQYTDVLSESLKLAMQHLSSALELKKRVGKGEIKTDEIPDGITEALKRDLINKTEDELAEKLNYQLHIRMEVERLGKTDETQKEFHPLLAEIRTSIGKRLDVMQEIQKLDMAFEKNRDKLSATELKSLEQEAARRLKSEYTLGERLAGFVPSEEEKNLSGLLQAYYVELMELEKKQENLNVRKEKTMRLIKLTEQEAAADSGILPLLRKQAENLKIIQEEDLVKARVQLVPEKAEEILANYETKTGRRLPTPTPVPEKNRPLWIEKFTARLFDQHNWITATGKWISLFEQRLSPSGLDTEIVGYRNRIADMDSARSAVERRIKYLTGHPLTDLAKLAPDEKPRTEIEKNRFLEGEIGMLRQDRSKILRQAAMLVGAELACIFLAAVLITWLANGLISRIIARSRKSGGTTIAVTALLPLLKTVLMILIWMVAVISCLSVLGFDVGAILAGLGIGGLAIAMASKEALSDIIGGISILMSKSLMVDDLVLFNGEKALVEDIGLRYTRLRQNSTDFAVSVPNSLLAQQEAINISAARGVYVNIDIPLSTRNTEDQIQLAMKIIAGIVDRSETRLKNMRLAGFSDMRPAGFSSYAFIITVRYIIHDYELRHRLRTEIHSAIVRQFQQNHIEFAATPWIDVTGAPDSKEENIVS